jgi:hypothetical protein
VGEGAGQATILVTRSGGTGPASINFVAAGGTAVPGADFATTAGTLNFAPGQTSQSFTVTIFNDTLAEGDETILLGLSPNGDAVLGNPGTAVLTIQDDETPPAGTLEFDLPVYTVTEGGGVATITVSRRGGSRGAVAVRFATVGGSAVPGVDYSPVADVLVFADGETRKSFNIPILDDAQIEQTKTIGLVLGSPVGGVVLGPQSTAGLAIVDNDVDRTPPTIVDIQLIGAPNGTIREIDLTFSEPLDPARASNPDNYRVVSLGPDGRLGTRDDRVLALRSVVYVPGSLTVRLILARPIRRGTFLQIFVNGSPPSGLTDVAGNYLDGDGDGLPGGNFSRTVSRSSSLRYIDADGDIVTLQLRGGGVLELVRSASGEAPTLRVIGARPTRSVLSGSVRRAGGGNGTTTLRSVEGLGVFGNVRSTLRTPPFFVDLLPTVSPRALDTLLAVDDSSLGSRGLKDRLS